MIYWLKCSTWLPVEDVEVENDGDEVGEQGCNPVHHEHDRHAEEGSHKGQPRVVVLQYSTLISIKKRRYMV